MHITTTKRNIKWKRCACENGMHVRVHKSVVDRDSSCVKCDLYFTNFYESKNFVIHTWYARITYESRNRRIWIYENYSWNSKCWPFFFCSQFKFNDFQFSPVVISYGFSGSYVLTCAIHTHTHTRIFQSHKQFPLILSFSEIKWKRLPADFGVDIR